jgi:hypothetical protein
MALTLSSLGSGLQPNQQIFTSSGNWTVPAGVTRATVTCVGGGAVVGSSGGYIKRTITVTPAAVIPVVVGAAGVASSQGGTTTFGSLLAAYGGQSQANTLTANTNPLNNPLNPPSGLTEEIGVLKGGVASRLSLTPPSIVPSNTTAIPWYACPTPIGNLYLIICQDGRSTLTSTDGGMTWTYTLNAIGSACTTVVVVNGNFVALQTATGSTAYYSTNGTTWSTSALPSSSSWLGAVGNGTTAVASLGTTSIAISTNGTTWSTQTLPLAGIVWQAGGLFYFTNGATTYWSTTATTSSWTLCTGIPASSSTAMWYFNSVWMWVSAYNLVYTSTDGKAWTTNVPSTGNNAIAWQGVINTTYYMAVWVFSTTTSTVNLYSTTNGTSWTLAFTNQGTASQTGFPMLGFTMATIYTSLSGLTYQGQILLPNNRAIVIMTTRVLTVTWYFAQIFSEGFAVGNTTAGLTPTQLNSAMFPAQATTTPINNGTPEGFCKTLHSTVGVNQTPSYGDASNSTTYSAGQGVVIVEWWA